MFDFLGGENAVSTIYFYSIPFFIGLILFEMYYSHKHNHNLYSAKDTLTNVYFALMNYGFDLVLKVVAMGVMFFFY